MTNRSIRCRDFVRDRAHRFPRTISVLAMSLLLAACDSSAVEPCSESTEKPVLRIAAAHDEATGAAISRVRLSDITVDGLPLDTALLRFNYPWNFERDGSAIICTLPCLFGRAAGVYRFSAGAQGYYSTPGQVVAAYSAIPAGCPAAHGAPTDLTLVLTEADSARVSFAFGAARASSLQPDNVTLTFDDGSGVRTTTLPSPLFVTRNTGTLLVRVVLTAPDTIAVGDVELPLRKDWAWTVGVYPHQRDPTGGGFCVERKVLPLRRPVPGADSLYILWSGQYLSYTVIC